VELNACERALFHRRDDGAVVVDGRGGDVRLCGLDRVAVGEVDVSALDPRED
jgi:hypothetical protein